MRSMANCSSFISPAVYWPARRTAMREDHFPRFVRVPGREFTMGSDEGADDERPAHRVQVDSFYASVHPITVAQYAAFTRETAHPCPELRVLPRIVTPAGESSFRDFAASHAWHN